MFKWLNDWFNPLSWIKYFTQKTNTVVPEERNTTASTGNSSFDAGNAKEEQKVEIKSVRPQSNFPQLSNKNLDLNASSTQVEEAENMLAAIEIPGEKEFTSHTTTNTKVIKEDDYPKHQTALANSTKTNKEEPEAKKKSKGALHWAKKRAGKVVVAIGNMAKEVNPLDVAAEQQKLEYTLKKSANNLEKGTHSFAGAAKSTEELKETNKEIQNLGARITNNKSQKSR